MLSKQSYLVFFFSLAVITSAVAQQQVTIQGKEETIYSINYSTIYPATDLLPIKNILEHKEIIGMGEATHGTKEFFDLKSKMFIYLVQELHVKVFGMEASYSSCLYVNDYVLYGKGELDSVMRRLEYWMWQTEEVKQLIEWMRTFNQNKAADDKVSFYGFDMLSFNAPLDYLYNYIKGNYAEGASDFLKVIAPVYNRKAEIDKALFGKNRNLIIDTLERTYFEVDRWFSQKESVYKKGSSSKKYEQIKLCIQNFKESVVYLKYGGNRPSFRDSCMASTIQQIRTIENAKVFVWAHSEHIKKNGTKGTYQPANKVMGSYLKSMFGEKYYAIGFLFHQGTFLAVKGHSSLASRMFSRYILSQKFIKKLPAGCYVSGSPKHSIASTMSKFNQPSFFIDLTNTHNEMFTTRQTAYSIGAVFMNKNRSLQTFIPAQCYDGLFFVNNTNASHPLSYK